MKMESIDDQTYPKSVSEIVESALSDVKLTAFLSINPNSPSKNKPKVERFCMELLRL